MKTSATRPRNHAALLERLDDAKPRDPLPATLLDAPPSLAFIVLADDWRAERLRFRRASRWLDALLWIPVGLAIFGCVGITQYWLGIRKTWPGTILFAFVAMNLLEKFLTRRILTPKGRRLERRAFALNELAPSVSPATILQAILPGFVADPKADESVLAMLSGALKRIGASEIDGLSEPALDALLKLGLSRRIDDSLANAALTVLADTRVPNLAGKSPSDRAYKRYSESRRAALAELFQ